MALTDLSHSSTCRARWGSFLTALSQNASLVPIVLSHAFQGYRFRLFLFPHLLSFNDIISSPAYSAPNGHLLLPITHRDMDVGQAPQTHHGQNGIHCLPHYTSLGFSVSVNYITIHPVFQFGNYRTKHVVDSFVLHNLSDAIHVITEHGSLPIALPLASLSQWSLISWFSTIEMNLWTILHLSESPT